MADEPEIHETGTKARGASVEGVGRYVLGASLALIVILFAILYLYWA